jgi:hypothetical protein
MMLIVASVQFALATGQITTLLVLLIRTYIGSSGTAGTLDGPPQYWLGGALPEHVALEAMYLTNVSLSLTSRVLT